MNFRNVPPSASVLIQSLRGLGYTTPTALADIIDNAITAKARNVRIHFEWAEEKSWISVLDDGTGMTDSQLEEAMRIGARDPREDRSANDLGRFGMGLKTAGFSQARRLTVMSRTAATIPACLRWDLDHLSKTDSSWPLFEGADNESELALLPLQNQTHGTIVLLEKLDKIVVRGFVADDMILIVNQVKQFLGLTFHRYLDTPTPALNIFVNDDSVKPWDPFLSGNLSKALESPVYVLPGHQQTKVQCHVLPNKNRLTEAEAKNAAGPYGWVAHQGFYIYRNERLLVFGSWLRLGEGRRTWTCDEPHRLARISIDIRNDADSDWNINVMKSTASPPVSLRTELTRLGSETRSRARQVIAHRALPLSAPEPSPNTGALPDVWNIRRTSKGTTYAINREHDLVYSLLEQLDSRSPEMEALFRLIEETVPVRRIWVDSANDDDTPVNEFSECDEKATQEVLNVLYRLQVDKYRLSPEVARTKLLNTPPFDKFSSLVKQLR